LTGQVYTFASKSSIVTTNIQKTLQPTNTGALHAYIISKQ